MTKIYNGNIGEPVRYVEMEPMPETEPIQEPSPQVEPVIQPEREPVPA